MANLAVVTGVSRGLGASLAKLLLESGVHVIGISRSENKELMKTASDHNQFYQHFSCDLSDLPALEDTIDAIHDLIAERNKEQEIETLYIINNAGVVDPIHQAAHIESKDLIQHVAVNSVAPMVLTNQFLRKQKEHGIPLNVANVTSGAAEKPMFGWSAYCSTKASLNMYTKTVALEQKELGTENKVIGFSPGIMDTEMQSMIRSSSKEQFAEIERFKDYKTNKTLRNTDIVAGVLIDIITDEDVKNGKIYYISNYL